ncbi:hypothetical protein SAMN04488098_108113 [Alkalibacterium thalassium]|uniref:Uncharacterized protein n=1 Tax=Alkalibacterium thalassium TaxID=426701 RepID=A0A1G9FL69_9LACT|nr:hypothetical protein SAMN04488098_108113 [Alkalibacterium thalassium]
MMERTLKSPRNTYFFLCLVLLLASSAYLLLYEFSLRELSSITFDGTYTLIYLFIGRPLWLLPFSLILHFYMFFSAYLLVHASLEKMCKNRIN